MPPSTRISSRKVNMENLPDGDCYVVSIMTRYEHEDEFYGPEVEHYTEIAFIGHNKEEAIEKARKAYQTVLFSWVDLDYYSDGILISKIDFKEST